MKIITNEFKEQITKLGREIDFQFFLHTNDKLITEDSKFIMTQANAYLVVEQFDDEEVDEIIGAEDIYSTSLITRGEILSTMMKELDFEISKDLRIGDVIECQFGLKVGEDYEYVNYGKYMVYEKEYNEDTKTYSYIAYDRMMLTMQDVNQEFLADLEGRTLANSINVICGQVGLSYNASQQELEDYPNLSKQINEGTFTDLQMTYRDVLDMICQALGLSMIINPANKHLLLKPLNNTPVDTFNEQFLKDTNVSFGEKYGPVNSVVLSRSEDFDNIYRRDEESISENGLHEYKIKDNLIMLYDDREDYIDEIFEQLNGLEYYPCDFTSTGITYLDWLDFFNVTIGDKTYQCLMLDDEIEINQGLEENIYSEEPLETVTNYKTSSKTDKEVSFIVDKQNGSIKAKVSKGDVINEINLDESGVNIKGEKISLEGTVTANNNFKINTNGTMECKGATITNGKISLQDSGQGSSSNMEIQHNNEKLSIYSYGVSAQSTNNNVSFSTSSDLQTVFRCSSKYRKNNTNYSIDVESYTQSRGEYGEFGIYKHNVDTTDDEREISFHMSDDSTYMELWDGTNYTLITPSNISTPSLDVTGSKNRVVTIDDGKQVRLGAYETTTPYFGDIGSNKTDKNGYCKIEIEDIFSQTIELENYKVFIQECGEGHLYIEKYKDYFEVKGTPNLDFDWEIKAIQKGYKNVRLQEKESDK